MKAAVLYHKEGLPVYTDVPEPMPQHEGEQLLTMKAAAIKHLDKARASGQHYSSSQHDKGEGRIIGGDGVGALDDGTLVYALGTTGTIAEKAIADRDRMVPLPPGLDPAVAAALPNAVMGSAMALRFRARMKEGETVLINGGTGFTGKMAIQVAKQYGAKKIIATGRNRSTLDSLAALGADEMISLEQDTESLSATIRQLHQQTPIDIILDYLWGSSAETLLSALKGQGNFTHPTRFVSIGAMTGDAIQLSSSILRGTNLQLTGSGLGSWTKEEVRLLFSDILPHMFQLAADGKLKVETINVGLKEIERLWAMDVPGGKRLVVLI